MFRRVFNVIYVAIAMLIQAVMDFFGELKRVKNTRYRDLTWPKRILKAIMFGITAAILMSVLFFLFSRIIMFIVFFAVASSFGPAITNGMNEATGRNRRRRYYY